MLGIYKMKNKRLCSTDILYDFSLVSYLLWTCILDADFSFSKAHYLVYISVLFSMLCILKRFAFTIFNSICLVFSVSIAFFFFYQYANTRILPIVFLIFSSYGIKIDRIIYLFFRTTLFTTLLVVILSLLGILSNKTTDHLMEEGIYNAQSFGFVYYSFLAFRVLAITISYIYLSKENCSYKKLLLLFMGAVLVYFISYTRLQLLATLMIILLYILFFKSHTISLKSRIWGWLSLFAYPVAFLLNNILPFTFLIDSDFFESLDDKLSGRISLTILAFSRYGINWWGNNIEMVGAVQRETTNEDYFYIDSAYNYWLLEYGVVFSIFILGTLSLIFYRAYKAKDKFLYIWCSLFVVLNFVNDFFTYTYISLYPIFLYAKISNVPTSQTEKKLIFNKITKWKRF